MSAKKFNETAEFKKLKKEWDKKLANAGFDDIEKNEDEYIVRPQEFTIPANFKNRTPKVTDLLEVQESYKEDKPQLLEYVDFIQNGGLDYYQYCHSILREFSFKREMDREIFELYTEGVSERDIRDLLIKKGFRPITREAINYTINKILSSYRKS